MRREYDDHTLGGVVCKQVGDSRQMGAACLSSRYLRKSWSPIREEDWVLRSRNPSPLLWGKAVRERKPRELSVVGRSSVARSMESSAVALCSGNSEGHPAHSWSAYMSPFLQNVERLVKKYACFQSQILIYINKYKIYKYKINKMQHINIARNILT